MSDLKTAANASDETRVSYGIGRQMGDQLKGNSFEGVDVAMVQQGLADAMHGAEFLVEQSDLQSAFQTISAHMQVAAEAKSKEFAAEGEAYLAENAKKEGVETTESGLQYEVLVAGEGDKPAASDTVRVHYHGMLVDGSVFDSSVERGDPAEFPVGGVIQGWIEGLQLMTVGSKWKLSIPYQLAYGEQGSQGAIPPYAALVFEVELLAII